MNSQNRKFNPSNLQINIPSGGMRKPDDSLTPNFSPGFSPSQYSPFGRRENPRTPNSAMRKPQNPLDEEDAEIYRRYEELKQDMKNIENREIQLIEQETDLMNKLNYLRNQNDTIDLKIKNLY
jgi:hypothetical protein